jgi:hypothetical protein
VKGGGWWCAYESTWSRLLQPPPAGEGGHLLGCSSSPPRPAPLPQYARDIEGWPVWGGRRSSAQWRRGDEPAGVWREQGTGKAGGRQAVVLPTDLHGTSSSTSCRIQGRRPCSRTGSKAAALLTRSSIRVLRLLGAPRDGGRLAGGGSRSRPPSSPDPPPTVERERGVPPPPLLHRRRWERVRGGRRRGGAAPAHGLPVRGERRGRGGRRKRRPAGGAAPRGWGGRGG